MADRNDQDEEEVVLDFTEESVVADAVALEAG